MPCTRSPRPAAVALLAAAVALTACSTGSGGTAGGPPGARRVITVVAAENVWGSIAAQLGGDRVDVTSIIDNPDTDPHDYEPTARDGRAVAGARYVIYNGIGYDPWAGKLVAANAGDTTVLDVGDLVGVKAGGNPHRWYDPTDVDAVTAKLTADYSRLDPADAAYFAQRRQEFTTVALEPYHAEIAAIRLHYSGVKVAASESIFAMIAPALGLDLVTPPSFLTAISAGTDPTARDKTTIDRQLTGRQVRAYVVNTQNETPDVAAQVAEATAAGIPISAITETLTPATATWQQWQTAQLAALDRALGRAAGGGNLAHGTPVR